MTALRIVLESTSPSALITRFQYILENIGTGTTFSEEEIKNKYNENECYDQKKFKKEKDLNLKKITRQENFCVAIKY